MNQSDQCGCCLGTGKCVTCHGNGVAPDGASDEVCGACGSSGRCKACGGNGVRPGTLRSLWYSYNEMGHYQQRALNAAVAVAVAIAFIDWRLTAVFGGLVMAAVLYLRSARERDSV